MLTIGVRAHDFGRLPPADLAAAIAASGVGCVQLALAKALSGVPTDPAALGPAGAAAIRSALAGRGLAVAVLGCYVHPLHPDAAAREAGLARFEDHLRLAAAFGCRIVGTETGMALPPPYAPVPAAPAKLAELAAVVRRLAAVAAASGSVVGIEPVADPNHLIDSAAAARALLDAVGSPAVGIIFDPVNLVPSGGPGDQDAFLDACFAAFGADIVAVHAKDYRLEPDAAGRPAKSAALPAGSGELDWPGVFRRLAAAGKAGVPVLLENAGPADAPAAAARLRAAWKAAKLD
jgi:sugar phosphate isomerase/epimerase